MGRVGRWGGRVGGGEVGWDGYSKNEIQILKNGGWWWGGMGRGGVVGLVGMGVGWVW